MRSSTRIIGQLGHRCGNAANKNKILSIRQQQLESTKFISKCI